MIDVESWVRAGGIGLLAAIVFAESVLLDGFFLPGDSLLSIAGFLASSAGGHVLPSLPIPRSSSSSSQPPVIRSVTGSDDE
jgi:membrane protein DedA with SNARE-associated domain